MRYSSTAAAALVAAMSISDALAGPTHHRHSHKRDVDYSKLDWNNMGIDWAAAYAKGQKDKQNGAASSSQAPAPAAAYTQVPAPAASSAAATTKTTTTDAAKDVTDNAVQGVASLFGGIVGWSNNLKAFGGKTAVQGADGDSQFGNVGKPYGSNMIKIASGDTSKYDFTNTFYNGSPKDMTIVIWNKVGADGQPQSGPSEAPSKPSLSFALKPGQSQSVAFDEDTNGAWAQACDAKAASGAFATTWGEFTFRKPDASKNKGGSAYNLSAILNKNGNTYNMTIEAVISGPNMPEKKCVSDMNDNSWDKEFHPQGTADGNCYVPLDNAHLVTRMYGNI